MLSQRIMTCVCYIDELTEREIDGKEKNAGHINTPVFAGPPTQPVE